MQKHFDAVYNTLNKYVVLLLKVSKKVENLQPTGDNKPGPDELVSSHSFPLRSLLCRPSSPWPRPAVVLLRTSLFGISLISPIVCQEVCGDIMNLDTRRMVQHLQVFKDCLADLVQILVERKEKSAAAEFPEYTPFSLPSTLNILVLRSISSSDPS